MAVAVKNPPANTGDLRGEILNSGSGRSRRRRAQQPTPVFLPGEFHGQRVLWAHKESDMTEAT